MSLNSRSSSSEASTRPLLEREGETRSDGQEPGFPAPGQQSPYKRNTIFMSVSFFFVFVSFSSTQNLEANVLKNKSLGSVSLGSIYLSMFFVNGITPIIVNKLGVKTSLLLGMSCFVVFIASNLYESWYTLVPSGALAGAGAAVLWSAQGVFLSRCASGHLEYLPAGKQTYDRAMNQLSGLFWAIFQCTQIVGNLIAFAVFSIPIKDNDYSIVHNATWQDLIHHEQPGNVFRDISDNSNLSSNVFDPHSEMAESTKYVLFSMFALSAAFGTLFSSCTISNPPKDLESDHVGDAPSHEVDQARESIWEASMKGFHLLGRDRRLQFMVPIFIWSGFEASFAYGEITTHVIRPQLGEKYVPLVMTAFGLFNVIGSYTCSRCVSKRSQIRVLLTFAAVIQIATLIAIGFVQEPQGQFLPWYVVVLFASAWGLGDALYNALITSLLGMTFKQGDTISAFSQFKAWQSLATSIVFFISPLLSPPLVDATVGLETKAICNVGVCVIGTILFLVGESCASAPPAVATVHPSTTEESQTLMDSAGEDTELGNGENMEQGEQYTRYGEN